ncbi:hypothetical protein [Vallitalea maricola]|uniref:Uncharacterized protein n=1 Tax=Vallitalea maricola TaxID=3074433 RepID=A0ACB5UMX2_9FIRM|nr:hypothetical protein AN2V17_35530 [Vallitalea sp. AN17-2]
MRNPKQILGLVLLGVIILLTSYFCYFEFIYRSDLVTYFNIDAQDVTSICIIENKIGNGQFDENTLDKYEIDSKGEIIRIIDQLGNFTVKQKVYKQFKFNHGLSVSEKYDTLTNYMIILDLPNNHYNFHISGGRCISAKMLSKEKSSKGSILFEIVGEPFDFFNTLHKK